MCVCVSPVSFKSLLSELLVPMRAPAKTSSASCDAYTVSRNTISATCLSQFVLISSDSRQPTRPRFKLVQTSSNHACIRSTACGTCTSM